MILRLQDLEWLKSNFPQLKYLPEEQKIVGILSFCGAFEKASGQLRLGNTEEHRAHSTFLCDEFSVSIDLASVGGNGWPRVYEIGGRCWDIAEQCRCEMIDLHFYEDGACCLGLNFAKGKALVLRRFIPELLIPFFYRLSYTTHNGLRATRDDLWGEYSHGDTGLQEYRNDLVTIARNRPSRNQPCPCGSGLKFKKCHLDEVNELKPGQLPQSLLNREN